MCAPPAHRRTRRRAARRKAHTTGSRWQSSGCWRGHPATAYAVHHGITDAKGTGQNTFLDCWHVGPVWGTMRQGAFENDGFRRAWLVEVADTVGSRWRPAPDAPGFGERRERMLDILADAVGQHVDLDALLTLTCVAPPPAVAPSAPPIPSTPTASQHTEKPTTLPGVAAGG